MADSTVSEPTWTIYRITNLVNGKAYIGLTSQAPSARWLQHIADCRRAKRPLYRAILKYTIIKFSFESLYQTSLFREAIAVERGLISAHGTLVPNGYNLTVGGDGATGSRRSPETRKRIGEITGNRTPETREKMRRAASDRSPPSPETRAKLSIASKGRKYPPEFGAKIRARMLGLPGRPWTEEQKKKLSEALKGKPKPADLGEKISRAKMGMKFSEAHRLAIANAGRGRVTSPETKAKLTAALTGRKHTDEAKKNMRAAARLRSRQHRANRPAHQLELEV